MTITWQDLATAGIVLAALGYLVRCMVRWARRKGLPSCGCGTRCPVEKPEKTLVVLDQRPPK